MFPSVLTKYISHSYDHYFNGLYTVAQKTVQVFACFGKIALVQNADIIQGPDFFIIKNKTYYLSKTF